MKYVRSWAPGYADGEGGKIPSVPADGATPTCDSWLAKLLDKGMPVVTRVDALDLLNGNVQGRTANGHDVLVTGYTKENGVCKFTFIDPAEVASDFTTTDENDKTYYPEYYYFHTFEITAVPEPAATTLGLAGLTIVAGLARRRS